MTEETEVEQEDGDDLEALLKEFEIEPEKKDPEPEREVKTDTPAVPPELDGRVAKLEKFIESMETKTVENELNGLAASAKDEHPALKSLPDSAIIGHLQVMSAKDERVLQAWNERHAKPAEFNKVVSRLTKELADSVAAQPDPQLTADREAARSYVNSQDVEPTNDDRIKPQPELARMTRAELDEYAKEKIAEGRA